MVRVYKRKVGARRYADYTPEVLEECLNAIRTGALSHRKASVQFKIPRRTILNKLKGYNKKPHGKQTVFSREEEESFVSYVEAMSDFGFPLTSEDLGYIVKAYLDKIDRKVNQFNNNLPGKDWKKGFLRRYARVQERFASNIKRSRAAVNEQTVREYISNLEEVVKDCPAENVWNLDETNLTDDPGKKKVICRRGTKYPEKVCNFSKSSTSLMLCGNAAGELLPPFVVYKATQLWNTWTEGGPPKCRYMSSKSGWFDTVCFTEWFESTLMPRLKKQSGKRVVIADNLSTHINVDLLKKCRDQDIHFVCLPPNSTHLTQPLDVAFFRPMKVAWRKVLSEWKATPDGLSCSVLPKHHFPPLLKRAMEELEPKIQQNLESGFKKCGIYPCDVQPLLDRIARKEVEPSAVSEAFLEHLQMTREAYVQPIKLVKKKKINLPAGKSLSHAEIAEVSEQPTEPQPSTSGTVNQHQKKCKKTISSTKHRLQKLKKKGKDCGEEIYDSSSDDDWETAKRKLLEKMEQDQEDELDPVYSEFLPTFNKINKRIGSFVVFKYEDNIFPGVIESFDDEGVSISAMKRSVNNWKWPENKDELYYKWEDVLGGIEPPKMLNKRGVFAVPELRGLF